MLLCSSNIFMLNALFTFELFALTCAIFLLVYVKKQQLNKWYKCGVGFIALIIALIFICTAVNAFCGDHEKCEKEKEKSCINKHHEGGEYHSELKEKHHKKSGCIHRSDKVDSASDKDIQDNTVENIITEEETGSEE